MNECYPSRKTKKKQSNKIEFYLKFSQILHLKMRKDAIGPLLYSIVKMVGGVVCVNI